MLIGYARVSTIDQETHLQLDALRRAGVQRIVEEKTSSVGKRPKLQQLLDALRPGDRLLVYRLDRLARSLRDLLSIIERLERANAGFASLSEPIDTATPAGRLMLQMLGAVGEFERTLIRERSVAGQVSAINRGVAFGRPRKLAPDQEAEVLRRCSQGETKTSVARAYGVSIMVVRRVVAESEGRLLHVPRPVLSRYLSTVSHDR